LRLCNAINDPASTSLQPTSSDSSSSEPPAVPSTSTSSSSNEGTDKTGLATDKWEETLSVHHTLSSLYLRTVKVQPFVQLDHEKRRKEKELKEICQAGGRLGASESMLRENMAQLESLLPDLHPNLDQMKASDWVKVLKNIQGVTMIVITLREQFPRANISAVLKMKPKLLLGNAARIQEDARQVKAMLSKVEDVDAIIEAVPYLLDPYQLAQSLANLKKWFPNQDTLGMLQKNPKLLVNIGEADLEADPLYGADVGVLD